MFDSEVLFQAVAGAVGVIEAVAWGVDLRPWTAHSEMTVPVRVLQVGVNATPHLLAAATLPASTGWYIPYSMFFCSAQACNWWWPYLGIRGRKSDELSKHVADIKKILPDLKDGKQPAPSAEHTLLFPLSVTALGLALKIFVGKSAAEQMDYIHSKPAVFFTALAALLSTGAVVKEISTIPKGESNKNGDGGMKVDPLPFVHAALVGGGLIWLHRPRN